MASFHRVGRNLNLHNFYPRTFSSIAPKPDVCNDVDPLVKVLECKIEAHREEVIAFRRDYGKKKIGEITVNQVYGGLRGVTGLVTETSMLDQEEGIRIRGFTIPDLQTYLPKAAGGCEPLPEGVFWLLLTGQIASTEQVKFLSAEWAKRGKLPKHVETMLDTMPRHVHPMAQFSSAITLCNTESKFVKAYNSPEFNKKEAWRCVYEDVMDLIARLVPIGAKIYNNTYRGVQGKIELNPKCDWTQNYCNAIDFCDPEFVELMRMYFTIHCDHEGGNVAAHTTHMVGSTLADPYLALAAGLNGLAGPLHGLANQEVLVFLENMRKAIGDSLEEKDITAYVQKTLDAGKVIPGYGHAVLRKTDPRYLCLREFAIHHMPDDNLFKLVAMLYHVVPCVLKGLGKVQNPWPNVDAHSGVCLQHYCLTEKNYYTVLFGMSRALGVLASLIWDRALLLPIERPKSITTDALIKMVTCKR